MSMVAPGSTVRPVDQSTSGGLPPASATDVNSPVAPSAAASRNPSSRSNIPAACAAASAPKRCPTTTLGRIPTLDQSAVSAHCSAYIADRVQASPSWCPRRPRAV